MEDKPITTDDLYGKTQPEVAQPLEYEETPIIEPVAETPIVQAEPTAPPPPSPATPKRSSNILGTLATILFFILLFALGVWLSTVIRQYLPVGFPTVTAPAAEQEEPETVETLEIAPTPADPFATWTTYQVIRGATKQVVAGVSFKLPQSVVAPICDGANCASQGTYLPGGTRFTIATRGQGQLLSDFRGSQIVDVGGRPFTMKETTIAGRSAIEFSGLFTGTTVGGYSFNQMRGMMIEVDPALSLEVNHFTPGGVNADFASDDALFNTILETFTFSASPSATGLK